MIQPDLLEQDFIQEFAALEDQPPLRLEIDRVTAWVVLAQLQLALRHPENMGPSAEIARAIAQQLQSLVASRGALAVVARCGWDTARA